MIRVSEVFGPTIQGEGPNMGRLASFIRLSGCNLDCSWCDTPYTWDWTGKNGVVYDRRVETTNYDPIHLVARVPDAPLVVITGGEPMLQQLQLREVWDLLLRQGRAVEVETNGTLVPHDPDGVRFNVSPKLGSSGCDGIRPKALIEYRDLPGTAFKFVVADDRDLVEIDRVVNDIHIPPTMVWLMPEGRTAETLTRRTGLLADAAIARGYNLTSRLHVVAWGDQRGV